MGNTRSSKEIHLDSDYIATGTNDGADGGLTLRNMSADFKSCGIGEGVAVYNDTDGSSGLTVTITESEILCTLAGGTNNTWTKGDTYYIYKTATKDSFISALNTDRLFGRKVSLGDQLTSKGRFSEDTDLDERTDKVFSPGYPEKSHGGL